MNAPRDWTRTGELNNVPMWRWRDEAFHAVTGDMDQLLFIGAALARFDEMTAAELHGFLLGP